MYKKCRLDILIAILKRSGIQYNCFVYVLNNTIQARIQNVDSISQSVPHNTKYNSQVDRQTRNEIFLNISSYELFAYLYHRNRTVSSKI